MRRVVHFWFRGAIRLAHAHELDPRVFIFLSALGLLIHSMYYLPCFKGGDVELAFLVTLRVLGLAAPIYILLRGRRIAHVFNISLALGYSVNTAWHVCYYVFL